MGDHPKFDRANQIRRMMAMIRRELNDDVEQVEDSARTLLNWRYYTTQYPWACVSVAAVLGYFVVPRKLEILRPDPKTIEEHARKKPLVYEQKPKAKAGLVAAAFSIVSGLALKMAMAQLGQKLVSMLDQGKPTQQPDPASASQEHAPRRTSASIPPRR